MLYVAYDDQYHIIGFYDEDIHNKKYLYDKDGNIKLDSEGNPLLNPDSLIPEQSIPITEEQRNECLNDTENWIVDVENKTFIYQPDLDKLKQRKIEEVKLQFTHYISSGYFHSTTLNSDVNVGEEHLRNVNSLIEYMQNNNLTSIQFRLYDNSFRETTLEELQSLKLEMVQFGLDAYHHKWDVESQINSATSIDELQQISF